MESATRWHHGSSKKEAPSLLLAGERRISRHLSTSMAKTKRALSPSTPRSWKKSQISQPSQSFIQGLTRIVLTEASITKTHTDLDCVFLNSGVQKSFDFSKPETVNLDVVQTEFTTNYLSNLALTNAFLPFLKSKKEETALI